MSNVVPKEDTVGYIMSKPVRTIRPDDKLAVALETMVKHDVGAVVVTESAKPIGIITERDITRLLVKEHDVLQKPVKEVMSKPLVTATPTMTVQLAFETMLKNKIRRLIILDGSNLAGIVTEKDLMRWVLRVSYEPNIPRHIKAILGALSVP